MTNYIDYYLPYSHKKSSFIDIIEIKFYSCYHFYQHLITLITIN